MKARGLLASGLVLALAGCAAPVASVRSHALAEVEPESIQGPYVPEGSRFVVRLRDPLDTTRSAPGQRFRAELATPLLTPGGQVLVPPGTTLHGTVVSTGTREHPRLVLRFDSIETTSGRMPLSASLREADYARYPGPRVLRPVPVGSSDAWLAASAQGSPFAFGDRDGPLARRGIRWEEHTPREVHLAAGARIELELKAPLLPPGTVPVPRG